MRTTTVLNKISAITSRIDSVFRSALYSRPSLPELHEQLNAVLPEDIGKLPSWARDRIACHRCEWIQRLNRDYLMQLYVLPDGSKVICRHAWDSFNEDTRQMIREGGQLPIKTFWLKIDESCQKDGTVTRISTPTDDVYFDSSVRSGKN